MALGIVATFNEAYGTVSLTISGATAAAGGWQVTRTDLNGTATVRVYASLALTNPTPVIDYECALSGTLVYTVTAGAASASTTVVASTKRTWLGFPIYPNYNLELTLGSDVERSYKPTMSEHHVLNRDDPVVITGAFNLASGRLSMLAPDYVAAQAIVAAYRRTRTAHLRAGANGMSLYHQVRNLTISPAAARSSQQIVRGEFLEVARPIGALRGTLAWTYANTSALGVTYSTVNAVFPTYADRTAGAP